jgi:hypothetical protein
MMSVSVFLRQIYGLVGSANRDVQVFLSPPGILLRVEGGSDFHVSPDGREITRPGRESQPLEGLDLEILQGPALVLAFSMRAKWCLHASAARLQQDKTIAFLGESGYGKSTLAGHLGRSGWQRVADDILPVTLEDERVLAWPHFPQLKLPEEAAARPFPARKPAARYTLPGQPRRGGRSRAPRAALGHRGGHGPAQSHRRHAHVLARTALETS